MSRTGAGPAVLMALVVAACGRGDEKPKPVAIELVGLDGVRDHLFSATSETWADACKAAGTAAEALDAAVAARRGSR